MGRLRQAIKAIDCQRLGSDNPAALRIGLAQKGGSKWVAQLLAHAGAAMCRAKRDGRNNVLIDPPLQQH